MNPAQTNPRQWGHDLTASFAVFLVALPLCLGMAAASKAPHMAGIISGIVGGIVVGLISKSHSSVSGPAAGLTSVVLAQLVILGSFENFLTALFLAGIIQIILGLCKGGFIADYFPSSVVKGMLFAIGIILILKQIPHLVGHDYDPEGEMSFFQPDQQNTFTEIIDTIFDLRPGALVIGFISLLVFMGWERFRTTRNSIIPGPIVIVVLGVILYQFFKDVGSFWVIEKDHLVQVHVALVWEDALAFLKFPNFGALSNPAVYLSALTIAIVASLETLVNLDAIDKIDPEQRISPPSRELVAQGIGNMLCGLIGGIPVTSVIVRSTVNLNAGAKTKYSAVFHGVYLLVFVVFFPTLVNQIPLASLAAILIVTGYKLADPRKFIQMWKAGQYQFIPFISTIVAIMFTDLLIGIIIGLTVSIYFILQSNLRRPLTRILEKHISGDVLRIRLANQVSFLNRPTLSHVIENAPDIKHILFDATDTDYIDPDILDLLNDIKNEVGPAHGIEVSLVGFRTRYAIDDHIQFVDYTSQDVRNNLTPNDVIDILKAGNARFLSGERLGRDLLRQVSATAASQFPMAVILSCIDSRAPTEMIFDLGLGDVFTIRIAGNVAREKVLGSMEYACCVAGAKLIVVLGHTGCGAVTTAVKLAVDGKSAVDLTGCEHIDALIDEIQQVVDDRVIEVAAACQPSELKQCVDAVARMNVEHTMQKIQDRSTMLRKLVEERRIKIIGGMYDIRNGKIEFFER